MVLKTGDTKLMKPYITFTLDFKQHISKDSLLQSLLSICPFDHLPREIRKIRDTKSFEIQVFFSEVEYLELIYGHLEKKSVEMVQLLNNGTCGKVSNVEIGIVS